MLSSNEEACLSNEILDGLFLNEIISLTDPKRVEFVDKLRELESYEYKNIDINTFPGWEEATDEQKNKLCNFVMTHYWVIRAQKNNGCKITLTRDGEILFKESPDTSIIIPTNNMDQTSLLQQFIDAHTFRKQTDISQSALNKALLDNNKDAIDASVDKITKIAKEVRNWVRKFSFEEYNKHHHYTKHFPQAYSEFLTSIGIVHLVSSTHPMSYMLAIVAKTIEEVNEFEDRGVGQKIQRPYVFLKDSVSIKCFLNQCEGVGHNEDKATKFVVSASASFLYRSKGESADWFYKFSASGAASQSLSEKKLLLEHLNSTNVKIKYSADEQLLFIKAYANYAKKLKSIIQIYLINNANKVLETGRYAMHIKQPDDITKEIRRCNIYKSKFDRDDKQFRVMVAEQNNKHVPVVRAVSSRCRDLLKGFKQEIKNLCILIKINQAEDKQEVANKIVNNDNQASLFMTAIKYELISLLKYLFRVLDKSHLNHDQKNSNKLCEQNQTNQTNESKAVVQLSMPSLDSNNSRKRSRYEAGLGSSEDIDMSSLRVVDLPVSRISKRSSHSLFSEAVLLKEDTSRKTVVSSAPTVTISTLCLAANKISETEVIDRMAKLLMSVSRSTLSRSSLSSKGDSVSVSEKVVFKDASTRDHLELEDSKGSKDYKDDSDSSDYEDDLYS